MTKPYDRENDLATANNAARMLPNNLATLAVSAVAGSGDFSNLGGKSCLGRFVYLSARGADVTILQGSTNPTAGVGFTIKAGTYERVWVPQNPAYAPFKHIASGAGSLDISWVDAL